MVDSSDTARLSEARNELHRILTNVKSYENALFKSEFLKIYPLELSVLAKKNVQNELQDACVLVFANKQDSRNALPVDQVANNLGLHGLTKRCW